jgi:hypothetical protein
VTLQVLTVDCPFRDYNDLQHGIRSCALTTQGNITPLWNKEPTKANESVHRPNWRLWLQKGTLGHPFACIHTSLPLRFTSNPGRGHQTNGVSRFRTERSSFVHSQEPQKSHYAVPVALTMFSRVHIMWRQTGKSNKQDHTTRS